jgi:hypothetical protein
MSRRQKFASANYRIGGDSGQGESSFTALNTLLGAKRWGFCQAVKPMAAPVMPLACPMTGYAY